MIVDNIVWCNKMICNCNTIKISNTVFQVNIEELRVSIQGCEKLSERVNTILNVII